MKKRIGIAMLSTLALCQLAGAALNESRTLELTQPAATSLRVFQANRWVYDWTVTENNLAKDLTGYTPYMVIMPSNTAAGCVTGVSYVVLATAGTFRVEWPAASLNTNGTWIYEIGFKTNTNPMTRRQGVFILTPDPFAVGVGNISFSSNINASLYTWTGDMATLGTLTVGKIICADGSEIDGVTATSVVAAASVGYAELKSAVITGISSGAVHAAQTVGDAPHGIGSIAASNSTAYYHSSNPSAFVDRSVTNLLDSIARADATYQPIGSTNGMNGLVGAANSNGFLGVADFQTRTNYITPVDLGTRGATNLTANGVQAGTYNESTRVLDWDGTQGGTNIVGELSKYFKRDGSVTASGNWNLSGFELSGINKLWDVHDIIGYDVGGFGWITNFNISALSLDINGTNVIDAIGAVDAKVTAVSNIFWNGDVTNGGLNGYVLTWTNNAYALMAPTGGGGGSGGGCTLATNNSVTAGIPFMGHFGQTNYFYTGEGWTNWGVAQTNGQYYYAQDGDGTTTNILQFKP